MSNWISECELKIKAAWIKFYPSQNRPTKTTPPLLIKTKTHDYNPAF